MVRTWNAIAVVILLAQPGARAGAGPTPFVLSEQGGIVVPAMLNGSWAPLM